MKVSLERQGQNVVQLQMEVEADRAKRAYEGACRQLAHKVNIPGFRKGKAPKNVIEQTLGVEYIKRETLEHLVPEMLNEAIVEQELDVITEPEVNEYKFELGEPLSVSAKFEVRPDVTLGSYEGVSVTVPQAKLDDEQIDKVVEQLAESKATLSEIAPHAIAMNDIAVLDFDCYDDGKAIEGGHAEGLVLEIKEGNFFDGFCEQLIGAKPGDKLDVSVTFPKDYRNKQLAGKDVVFKVEIKGLRERIIPEINDELARTIGQETLAKLKDLIRERMESELKEENDSRTHKAVVDAVVANAKVDVPETMVNREVNMLIDQHKHSVEHNGGDWQEYQASKEFETFKNEKTEEAQKRVLTSLVLGAVIKSEKILVTDEELIPYLKDIAGSYNVPVKRVMDNPNVRQKVLEEVLANKVVKFLVEKAKVDFVLEEKKPEKDSEPKAKKVTATAGAQ
jgi:trigger factor